MRWRQVAHPSSMGLGGGRSALARGQTSATGYKKGPLPVAHRLLKNLRLARGLSDGDLTTIDRTIQVFTSTGITGDLAITMRLLAGKTGTHRVMPISLTRDTA